MNDSLNILGLPLWLSCKESACNAGDLGSIPGLRRSPGEGKGYSIQYSGMENSIDCIVYGVTKSWTQLSNFHFHFEHSLALPVFGIAVKTDLFQTIAKFSKFAGILNVAL